jgi:uncharacterized membrane protein
VKDRNAADRRQVAPQTVDEAGAALTRRAELIISSMLRWGVRASLLLFIAGTVIGFVRGPEFGSTAADLRRLTGPNGDFPRRADWLLRGVAGLHGTPLVVAGLLLLIATPVLRVAVSMALFAGQRDRTFVAITLAVLVLLLLSFVLGRAGP